jgi:two-component system sensor histidine kinase KdpD
MSHSEPHTSRNLKDKFEFDYPIGLIVIGICTALGVFLRSRVAITNVAMLFLLGVIVVSVTCRQGAAVVSALLAVTSFYYFCVPPWNSFVIEDYSYILILVTTLAVALVITTLTVKIRAQTDRALDREKQARTMYQLNRDLSADATVLDAARTAVRTLTDLFDSKIEIFLTTEQRMIARYVGTVDTGEAVEPEKSFAQSILNNGMKTVDLLRSGPRIAKRLGIPLNCGGIAVAVMSVTTVDRDQFNDPDQMHFLEALCNQIAAAIDRLWHSAAVREAELEIQTERARNALLNAVSHDIKTPLASIYGAATSLLEEETRLTPEARHELVESISDEAERLNRVVNNLLEMTSLDAGLLAKKDWRPLEEIIGAALTRLEKQLRDRLVSTHITEDLPWICVDDVLLEQVFVNILENAVKYTPAGSEIEIAAQRNGENVVVSIKDNGAGLQPGDETRVFEKFFRGKTDGARGVGLGLAICRAIVQGHGGSISAENSLAGGAIFRFELPIGGIPPQTGVVPETNLA